MVIGYLFSQTFSNIDYIKSLWIGLFSFLGADTIYKSLEGKLMSHSELISKNGNLEIVSKEKEKESKEKKNINESLNTKDTLISKSKDNLEDDVIGVITYE